MNSWIFILLISCLCGNKQNHNYCGSTNTNEREDCCMHHHEACAGIPDAWRRTTQCDCMEAENNTFCDCKHDAVEQREACGCNENMHMHTNNECGYFETSQDKDECHVHMTPPPVRNNCNNCNR